MKIPLVDLSRQHAQIAAKVAEDVLGVMERSEFILGPAVAEFEDRFARYCGVAHCIGVGNGTEAIELALRALGVSAGDEVVVPANTFIATALAAVRLGARPVLVDCREDSFLIDTDLVPEALTSRTRAIVPVHLYGQMAEAEKIREVAGESIPILEDAAQSQGASRLGRSMGGFGEAAATSFYPGKNLGAYGDGGAVLTSDDDLADRLRRLRNWGSTQKYHHPEIGFNSRLDTVQAVVLLAKLEHLDIWNKERQLAADRYHEMLADLDVVTPTVADGNEHVWHLYVIRVAQRDRVLEALNRRGVGAGIHYPTPLHLHGALADLGYERGDFPVAEHLADEILSLPMFPGITEGEQQYVVESLAKALEEVGV
ncbi:MAG TPA: DegT/DnrJ/EryC1/StrS family aminotransferase [Acidimicrobiia bacterium]